MNNKKSTKYRFILTLSDQDIAYVRLYNELKGIELKHSDSENSNSEKRKLFLRILLAYCNPHSSNVYATVPAHAAVVDAPQMMAPSPPPTPPPDTYKKLEEEEEVTPPTGLRKADGRIHFGDLKIDID
jgi:hypothetical protein